MGSTAKSILAAHHGGKHRLLGSWFSHVIVFNLHRFFSFPRKSVNSGWPLVRAVTCSELHVFVLRYDMESNFILAPFESPFLVCNLVTDINTEQLQNDFSMGEVDRVKADGKYTSCIILYRCVAIVSCILSSCGFCFQVCLIDDSCWFLLGMNG